MKDRKYLLQTKNICSTLYGQQTKDYRMVKGIDSRKRQYVEVVARFEEDGEIMPLAVIWEDGRRFRVDEVLDRRQATSLKVGGNGIRFCIRIGTTETYLYYEGPRWYVEAKVYESGPVRADR